MPTTLSNFPTVKVYCAFQESPHVPAFTNTGSASWTDISTYVRGVEIQRGRNHELSKVEVGTARIVLNNRDRRFDPLHTTGPYYPYVLPLRRIQVRAVWNAVTYVIFSGFVERWPVFWRGPKDSSVVLDCVDFFEPLANSVFSSVGTRAAERSDQRIEYVLTELQYQADDILLSTGGWTGSQTVVAYDFDRYGALSHVEEVIESEHGVFWIDGRGRARLTARGGRLEQVTEATFGDDPAAGELPYVDLVLEYDKNEIRNDIKVTRTGGSSSGSTASDATSIGKYFKRPFSVSTWLTSDTWTQDLADYLLAEYKEPKLRIREVILNGRMDTDLWPHLLVREVSDQIVIKRRPPGGGATITQTSWIESIEHKIQPSDSGWDWETVWSVSEADTGSYWRLGNVGKSELGDTTTLAPAGASAV